LWQSTTTPGVSNASRTAATPAYRASGSLSGAHYHHRIFARLIGSDGCVTLNHETYYISTKREGQKVALVVDAPTASVDVVFGSQTLKRLPIKNMVRDELPLEQYIALMLEQARSEERLRLALKAQWWRGEWDKIP
jgi:hypothetical protein